MLVAQIIAAAFLVFGSALVIRTVMAADLLDSAGPSSRLPAPPVAMDASQEAPHEWPESRAA